MSQDRPEELDLDFLESMDRDEPRSVLSLDHNGASSRIVIFGGRNVITLDRGALGDERPEGVSVTYSLGASVLPSVLLLASMFAAGMTVGYFLCAFVADIVRV